MYKRFGWNPEIRLDLDELMAPFPKKPSKIFTCSTFEIFHPLAKPYRNNIFKHIEVSPEHTFIILTKRPQYIDRPMPNNVWLGVSVTGFCDLWRLDKLHQIKHRMKFVSFEPLLSDIFGHAPNGLLVGLNWIIIGRLTGHGKSNNPYKFAVERIVDAAKMFGVPVFLKNNLKEIWGEPLIQEWPR
jgi:protein gp37